MEMEDICSDTGPGVHYLEQIYMALKIIASLPLGTSLNPHLPNGQPLQEHDQYMLMGRHVYRRLGHLRLSV